jgi:uncharacterized protein YndB with AHSA1/START domain
MAHNEVTIGVRAEDVFAVLLDAAAYPGWVVGARRLRDVDAAWPEPGSAFHHAIGLGPFELKDNTRMVEYVRPERVVLEARFRPAGIARITLTVRDEHDHAVVALEEHPVDGPVDGLRRRLFDAAVSARNVASLRRLRRLCERRAAARRTVNP